MTSIQGKILSLSAIVLFNMVIIWVVLTFYNQKTQEKYNDILQRYLRMNEITTLSQHTITSLNNYLLAPADDKWAEVQASKKRLLEARQKASDLTTEENRVTLTNYMNMIDSLVEAEDLSLMFHGQKNNEESANRFAEATRISQYISETTLTLIDKEMRTYDQFYRGIIQRSADLKKLGFLLLGLITIILLPAKFDIINWERVYTESERWLREVGLTDVSAEQTTGSLGIGKQQQVEIAKALMKNANILILDEPTAALTEQEVAILLRILRDFKRRGVTCIYISHKLNEVFDIADTITVLRDGTAVGTFKTSEITEEKVVSLMVGRELKERFPRIAARPGDAVLKVKDYTVMNPDRPGKKAIDNVSFEVRKGEIFGIAGLMGAGRTELVMSLFGAYPGQSSGTVEIEGKPVKIRNTQDAIKAGMALVSEDRKKYGLVLGMDIKSNVTLASLKFISSGGILNLNQEIAGGQESIRSLKIKANSVETVVGTLSGGNQQKVVLGKWLMTSPKILFLDEPTRGIDVGAKFEIYNIINELVGRGVSVVMVSSELPELLGMCHRIMVLSEGRRTGEFAGEDVTQEQIMTAATGGKDA